MNKLLPLFNAIGTGTVNFIKPALFLAGCFFALIELQGQNTYSFTSAGATGSLGPTQTQVTTYYGSSNLNGLVVSTNGIQSWTVPASGLYQIDIAGASGGNPANYTTKIGGLGSRMIGSFNLNAGDVIRILVGQKGADGTGGSGGGGGTFVTRNNVLLIAAGGGGGGCSDNNGANSTTLTTGTNDNPGGSTPGGSNGSGGSACNTGGANHGGAGGGYSGDGATSTLSTPGGGGFSFLNGGVGGTGTGFGGFGGGGGGTTITVGGGGGGGYSGGAGGQQVNYCTAGINRSGGGGGGSINNGTNQNNTAGVISGNGFAVFTELCLVTLTSASNPICYGNNVVLTTNSANTPTWSAGTSTSNSIAVNPSVTTTYSVTGTGSANCVATAVLIVTVMPLPNVSAVAEPTTLCVGNTATLGGLGASTFTWSTGPSAQSIQVAPIVSTVYSFTGASGFGCKNTGTVMVNVNTNSITVSPNATICRGNQITLNASGAVNYAWSSGSPFSFAQVHPTITTTYIVLGTDAFECNLQNSVTVSVTPLPPVTVSANNYTICKGESVTLSAGGASTYSWSNGSGAASQTIMLPIDIVYHYTVTGTDSQGCRNTATLAVVVGKCTGIAETKGKNLVTSVSPNPFQAKITVEIKATSHREVVVTDLGGRVIYTGRFAPGKTELDLSTCAPGIYYLKVFSGSSSEVIKIVRDAD